MRRHTGLVAPGAMKMTTTTMLFAAAIIAAAIPASGDDAMLQPGQSFPAFELPAHDGSTVSSADLEGTPYLLFFYPKANTGG
jgi:cytochrome oxidase Cu insertion factor (SCO1/SenC/PrrC family)